MTPRAMASLSRRAATTCSCTSRRFRWTASRRSPKGKWWSSRSRPARRDCTPRTSLGRSSTGAARSLLPARRHTGRGENTSAAWGVTNFLLRLLERRRPDYLAWVHDVGESFRHVTYPAYKATREKLTDELQQDFDRSVARIEQILGAFRVPVVGVEGFEADDVIGTLASAAAARGLQVVIVSGDKDFYQLIGPGVALLNPGRG